MYVKKGADYVQKRNELLSIFKRSSLTVQMKLLNVQQLPPPEHVFATPTYLLNGRVLFLGNLTRDELNHKLTNSMMATA